MWLVMRRNIDRAPSLLGSCPLQPAWSSDVAIRSSQAAHLHRDGPRVAGLERIIAFARDANAEPVRLPTAGSVEAIVVVPAAAQPGVDGPERVPVAAQDDLQLDELPARRHRMAPEPAMESDGLAVEHPPPAGVHRAPGANEDLDLLRGP